MACATFGSASDFSIFLFGNYSATNTTIEGRVAAGGSVAFTDQNVGASLPVSPTRADLIIGGDINITRGVNNGNTIVSPASTVLQYTMSNVNGVTPQPIVDAPIDFDSARSLLQCQSQGWGALAPNGSASNFFGLLQLTGSDPVLNVITFNGNDVDGTGLSLEGASQILLDFPPGATVLINVLGTNVGFGNYTMQVNGASPPDPSVGAAIVWNFPQATVLRNNNGILTGSIFAPFADMAANGSSQLNGQLIAGSYNGASGQLAVRFVLFNGCLPEIPACGLAALTVNKHVNGAASFTGTPGTPLTYTILVTNTSTIPVNNILIDDESLGISQTVPLLNPGDSSPFIVDSAVRNGKAGTQYANTVVVTSENAPIVTAMVTVTIAALPINVQFVKSASQSVALPGEQIVYQFSLFNLGNADLTNVRLVDPTLGLDLSLPSFFSGMLAQRTFTVPLDVTPGSTITNTARLTADNLPNPGFLDSSASVSIASTLSPLPGFRKLATDPSPLPGDTIDYFYVIQNQTGAVLQSLIVNDPTINFTDTVNILYPDTTIVLEAPFTVPSSAAAGTAIVNTATLTGSFNDTLESSATVVVEAMLSLLATIDQNVSFVNPSNAIDYTLRVLNNGNMSLLNVLVIDQLTGFQTTIASLPAGQSRDFNTSFIVPAGTSGGALITNTVVAQAEGVAPVTAQVTAVVVENPIPPMPPVPPIPPTPPIPPSEPAISLSVAVSTPLAAPGETITFTGTVTNISAVTARNIILRSPLFRYASVLELLQPGATLVLTGNFTIANGTPPNTPITGSLSATSITIPFQEAFATSTVLPQAALELTNTLNETEVVQGETVVYTVTGSNTGNVPLLNVLFNNPALNQQAVIEKVSAGSFLRAFFRKPVTEVSGTTFCNTITAATREIGTVSATACYTVFGLQLHKQASTSIVSAGGLINYSVVIRNPMSVQAAGIVFRDPIPAHTVVVPGSVKLNGIPVPDAQLAAGIALPPLGANEMSTVSFALTVISDPENGSITNRAEADFVFPSTSRKLRGTSLSNIVQVAVEEHEE